MFLEIKNQLLNPLGQIKKSKKIFKLHNNRNQNLWFVGKAELKEKCIALNAYIVKLEKLQIND